MIRERTLYICYHFASFDNIKMKHLHDIFVFLFIIFSVRYLSASNDLKLAGIFNGHEVSTFDRLGNLSLWANKQPTVVVMFTIWCNDSLNEFFNVTLMNLWNRRSIPMITWQMFVCGYKSQPGIIKLVNNHTYDDYINDYSDRMKVWLAGRDGIYGNDDDRRVYIRLAHEMNGYWYPWSQNSTPAEYVSAWRHVHQIFSSKGIDSTRLQWVWSVNYADFGNYTAEEYWVGDDYVDWLGVDGYNFGASRGGSWIWPNEIFDHMIIRLKNISSTKPIGINECGSTTIRTGNISDIQMKSEWLNRWCNYVANSTLKMASYFNIDYETDWAIFGGMHGDIIWNNYTAYSAYKTCLQSDQWLKPNSTNQRILTDEQFAGIL